MILISSPRFDEHTPPPGHPERPERAQVFDRVASAFAASGGVVIEPRLVADAELARAHTPEHLASIARTEGRAVMIDADTYTSTDTYQIARLAAGAALQAARHAWSAREPAVALVRPPGHHAEADRAMGFCFYNNVAIAAAALRAEGAARVAIVDIDVHHGNGTQAIFYDDPTVLYVSSHQFPFYPGTGAADETGAGAGKGFTVNVPFAAGTRDDVAIDAYRTKVVPALESFEPEVLLISAGFDAHELDPLGGLRLTTAGYTEILRLLGHAGEELCGRRIAAVTEGGYHLEALAACLDATIDVLR